MTMMTGGQAAVEALKTEKVNHVFGLIGSATMEIFDALYDAPEINWPMAMLAPVARQAWC